MIELITVLEKLKEKTSDEDISPRGSFAQMKVEWFNNSDGDLDKADGYNCNVCRNKGYICRLEGDSEVLDRCKCQRVRATLLRAKRSGLGDVLRDLTFDKFEAEEDWQKEIKDAAQRFCRDEDAKWFYIGGQVGCGKSHICTAVASHYIKVGKDVRYMLWAEDSKWLKANVNEDAYQSKMDEYKRVDVLYIDDFLKTKQGEAPTIADINIAFEIINHRMMSNDKITIISSERMLSELIDYDEATMSRIFQKAGKYKFSIAKDRSKNYRLKH